MDSPHVAQILGDGAQASKAALADETSTNTRSLDPVVEDYDSDESSTKNRSLHPTIVYYDSDETSTKTRPLEPTVEDHDSDQSEASRRSSNNDRAMWDSPKVSRTDKAESTIVSSGTTLITGPVIETKPRGVVKKVEPKLKTHLTLEPRPILRRVRHSSTTRIRQSNDESDVSGSISSSESDSEENTDHCKNSKYKIGPEDSAFSSRPRVARPRRKSAPVIKEDTSRTRRRSSPVRTARNRRALYPQRSRSDPPVEDSPGYPHPATQPWPPYPPHAGPTTMNPFASPYSGEYAPPAMMSLPSSGYAHSTMPGATLVPWGYWPPAFHRPSTPPPKWWTPTPTPPTPPPPPPPRSPPPPPPDPSPQLKPGIATDPIELIESYLEALKESKQKQLLDASRILTWVDRKLGVRTDTPTLDPNAFRLPDNDTETSEICTASSVISAVAPSVLTHSTVRSRILNSESERRAPEDRMINEHLAKPYANLSRSLQSDNTVRPYHLRNRSSTEGRTDTENHHGTENEITQSYDHSCFDIEPTDIIGSKVTDQIQLLRQDVISLQSRLHHSKSTWPGLKIGSVWARWKKAFRKNPPPGTQRLEWTCECGEELFDDFPITNASKYQQILASLQNPAPTARLAYQIPSHPPDLEAGNVGSNVPSHLPTPNSFSGNAAPGTPLSGSGSTCIASGSPQSLSTQSGDAFTRTKYLELCVNVCAYETKLTEIKFISSSVTGATICTDGHLFRQIYDAYFSLRKDTWRRLLYRPAGIKFVHFGVEYDHRVDLYNDEPFPPEDMIVTKKYEYNPPPIDSRTFLHHFWKHKKHSKSTSARYVGRLPKKLGESLLSYLREAEQREGWGIHIIEGPNKPVICCVLLIVLMMSFITAAVYDAVIKNGDSGFAIGQWMVAALTVALSALYFSLEDDVITSA